MTAPTLLAMSDDQITNEALKYWLSWGGQDIVRFTRAIIAARDAQWAARHNTWVDGINKAMAAEVDRLQHMLSNADNEWQARLAAAVRDERADAERYRLLRSTSIDQWDMLAHFTDAALDAAIDAIRARTKD